MKLPLTLRFERYDSDVKRLTLYLSDLFRATNEQVNRLTEGKATARHNASAAMPTSGTYKSGDFVPKASYAIAGVAPNRYVVKGWNRITDGGAHVLDTDWTEDRALIGS